MLFIRYLVVASVVLVGITAIALLMAAILQGIFWIAELGSYAV